MDYDDNSLNSMPTTAGGARPLRAEPYDEPSAPTVVARGVADAALGQIDQYQLVRKLGGGGFGVVYLARDTVSGVDVALKTLHPLLKSNPEEMEALRAKFALVSRLVHTNIASPLVLHPCRDIAITDDVVRNEMRLSPGDFIMVMRYAPGVTLSKWRRQFPDGVMPLDQALEVVRQVASALDYAHGEKIVHRDIKPANIMVETIGVSTTEKTENTEVCGTGSVHSAPSVVPKLRVRILDFGLAAEIRSSMSRISTETGDTSGTRPYMAPEQWLGRKQDGRTDQYALACVAYELLSGAPPFSGAFETGDPAIMKDAVVRDPPEEIEGIPAHVNAELQKALAKNPKERFESCAEFVWALSSTTKDTKYTKEGGARRLAEPQGQDWRDPSTLRPQSQANGSRRRLWPWLLAAAVVLCVGVWRNGAASSRGEPPAPVAPVAPTSAPALSDEARRDVEEAEYRAESERKAEQEQIAREEAERRARAEAERREEAERKAEETRPRQEVEAKLVAVKGVQERMANTNYVAGLEALKKRGDELNALRAEAQRELAEAKALAEEGDGEKAKAAEEKLAAVDQAIEANRRIAEDFIVARLRRQGEAELKAHAEVERKAQEGTVAKGGGSSTIDLGGGVSLEMVHCPSVSSDFWMGKYEVTQEQWQRVMGGNPSSLKETKNPVDCVSWNDCQEFIRKLNALPGARASGLTFCLPTEQEWKTACRAGAPETADYCKLKDGTQITASTLSRVAKYGASDDGPVNVGSFEPNAWGLYDMHGNVWEWTETEFRGKRMLCGGSFEDTAELCSAGAWSWSNDGYGPLGFRLAASGRAATR